MSHDALIQHLLDHSVRTGDFTLKSGRPSSWFIDSKQTVCRPEGLLLVADQALAAIGDDIRAIGGLTVGADPVAYGIAAVAATRARPAQLHHPQGGQGPRRGRSPGRSPRAG